MPELADLRNRTCIVGIGETAYTRGTKKSALELALEASTGAIEDAGVKPEVIDAVILPGGAGSGGTAGDFIANLGLLDGNTIRRSYQGLLCAVRSIGPAATLRMDGPAPYASIRHHPRTIGSGSGGDAQACPVASERGNEGDTDGHGRLPGVALGELSIPLIGLLPRDRRRRGTAPYHGRTCQGSPKQTRVSDGRGFGTSISAARYT